MTKFLPNLFIATPTLIFCSTFLYSWSFYKKFLGDYNFIVGINDHVTKGSSVIPIILISLFACSAGWAIETAIWTRGENDNSQLDLKKKAEAISFYLNRKKISLRLLFLLTVVLLLLLTFWFLAEAIFLIYNDQILFPTIVILGVAWGVVTALNLKPRKAFLQHKFLCFFLLAGFCLSSAKGYDDASYALSRGRHVLNFFTVGNEVQEATFMASLSGAHIIRTSNGDFYMRYFENKESIWLFNYLPPSRPRYTSILQPLLGLPEIDR